jgi:hypothetical protein
MSSAGMLATRRFSGNRLNGRSAILTVSMAVQGLDVEKRGRWKSCRSLKTVGRVWPKGGGPPCELFNDASSSICGVYVYGISGNNMISMRQTHSLAGPLY